MGMTRMKRLLSDSESVCSSLKHISPPFNQHHIKDLFRLGKYSISLKRPRPLLVKLNCFSDVADILSKSTLLPPASNVYIKPHLSQSERKQEQILLKERTLFVDAGTDHRSIKLHGGKLYVDNKIQGQISDGNFIKFSTNQAKGPPASSAFILPNDPSSNA